VRRLPLPRKEVGLTTRFLSHSAPVSNRKGTVGPLSALLVLVGGTCTLLGALGMPWLIDSQIWLYWSLTFDALNNFLPLWAMLIALGLALALLRRGTSRFFLSAASLALVVALIPIGIELSRMPDRAVPGSAKGIRIVQFNALNSNSELDAALVLALYSDADLIMVQEPNGFRSLEPSLRAAFPYQTPCPRSCDAVIYSRLRPLAADYATAPGGRHRGAGSREDGSIGFASMSLMGPDGEPFAAIATHFSWPYPPMPVLRQRDAILQGMAQLDRSRAVLAGDFNLTPWTHEMRRLDAEIQPMQRVTRALFSFPANLKGATYSAPLPLLPIDHVYAGSRWQLVSAERGPASGSDHYPVIVDLVMPTS